MVSEISEKLISRHFLDNGLRLEFWDCSRAAAGDRWQVVLEARVKIPLSAANLTREMPGLPEVVAALGPEITFSKKEVRNFVADVQVDEIIKQIESQLLSSLGPYLSHPEFAGRFIRKAYKEFSEKKRWCKD